MQERRKIERERGTGGVLFAEGRKGRWGAEYEYCVSNKGVSKGERIVAVFFAPCPSLSFYHAVGTGIHSFEFHLSQDGKDGIFVNRHV